MKGEPLPITASPRPGTERTFQSRCVPVEKPIPAGLQHARLRRTSAISSYAVSAALEALGDDLAAVRNGTFRLGVVSCVLAGCIQFTRRFYEEALSNPATASPLIFPETVFNAPASHLAAILSSTAINYTIVGDPGAFLQGLALGAQWIAEGKVDACIIIGAEEFDWLTAEALGRFSRDTITSEGSGAIYLSGENTGVELTAITDSYLFTDHESRARAIRQMSIALKDTSPAVILCDSLSGVKKSDAMETAAWSDWPGPRLSPKKIFGESLMAGAAWQCVLAAEQLRHSPARAAWVSFAGTHQQAIGACFTRTN